MPKLVMLKGLPASGKTTYAKNLVDEGYRRVNKDDLREMLNSSKYSKVKEKQVLDIRDFIVSNSLINGFNVVVDDTNFEPKHEESLRRIGSVLELEGIKVDFTVHDMDADLDTCIERNSKRASPVPEKVIRDMYRKYVSTFKPEYKARDFKDGLPVGFIVDVDGTIAHMHDRGPFDYSKVHQDLPKKDVIDVVEALAMLGYQPIFLTGRSADCLIETDEWIRKHVELPDNIEYILFSRASDDFRKDCVVKEEIYRDRIEPYYNILCSFDDRNQVVNMWRDIGITCMQVAPGDF